MPSAKTTSTELSVAFGILGIDDPTQLGLDLTVLFENTLSVVDYQEVFLPEYINKPDLYKRFVQCGLELRNQRLGEVDTVRWTGREQQAATVLVSQDVFVPRANTPISVKHNSNVVANPSPHNLFVSLPTGMMVASQAGDWFIETNYAGIQTLYTFVQERYPEPLPRDVRDFYSQTRRPERRLVQQFLKELPGNDAERFSALYVEMCTVVARESAATFNSNLASIPANTRPAVMERLVKYLTRINAVPYYLTGIDHRRPFGMRIPDLTTWRRNWSVISINAEGAEGRGQAVVNLQVEFIHKPNREHIVLPYHVEIRWSHGKFCGNPEGKLYKDFGWREVPFFEVVF